jgi:hypothetical protein
MPGHFSITKRDFGSTWPDVWGFRSHFTHNKGARRRKKKQYKKNGTKSKMALNKQQEKHERQATIQ